MLLCSHLWQIFDVNLAETNAEFATPRRQKHQSKNPETSESLLHIWDALGPKCLYTRPRRKRDLTKKMHSTDKEI